jgi:hypothetical protein
MISCIQKRIYLEHPGTQLYQITKDEIEFKSEISHDSGF